MTKKAYDRGFTSLRTAARAAISVILTLFCTISCLPSSTGFFSSAASEGGVSPEVYDNNGIKPILPITEGVLTVTSLDYYYEVKNDSLPGLHGGIDFLCDKQTKIVAICDGVVEHVGYHTDYGYNVILKHKTATGSYYYSRYAHLSKYTVEADQRVSQGQQIGLSGSTGLSYSPHLHLEIYTKETNKVDRYERAYSFKYYLTQGTDVLSRMKIYYHPISGDYNAQLRTTKLGSGGSCYNRCQMDTPHDHISNFADYISIFYKRSGDYYKYNAAAEQALIPDSALRNYIYSKFDRDGDGHLSFYEMMKIKKLDLSAIKVGNLAGIEHFSNLTSITTDHSFDLSETVFTLSASYKAPTKYTSDAGLCGTYLHLDKKKTLNLRSGPATSYSKVGSIAPEAVFRVTEIATCDTYTWGKVNYNGIEGWCVISEDTWTEQLSSTLYDYYISEDGSIRCSNTSSELVASIVGGTSTAELYKDVCSAMLGEGERFVGWATSEGGQAVIYSSELGLLEVFPSLAYEDVAVTLYAVIGGYNVAGDANDDGVADTRDVDALVRYLSGHTDAVLRLDLLDLNNDGKINNRDAVMLKQLIG